MSGSLSYFAYVIAVFVGVFFLQGAIKDLRRHQSGNYVLLFTQRFDGVKAYIKRFLLDEPKHLLVCQCERQGSLYVYEHRCKRADYQRLAAHPEKQHLVCSVYEHRADKREHLFVPQGSTLQAACRRLNLKSALVAALALGALALGVTGLLGVL